MKKIILSSFLILVLLTSSIYFLMPDKVRIDIENTRTKYSVYENGSFTLAAMEYVNLFDGTTKMRSSGREVTYWNDSQFAYAQRKSEWKDNITTFQTYTFGIYEEKVESFPLKNEFQCLNCEGKIVHFEIRDILYLGETKNIQSPFSFGHNMNIEWGGGFMWAKVYQQIVSDKIIIRYRPTSNDETYSVRLFDPPLNSWIVTGAESAGGNLNYDFVDFKPGSTITINATGYLNITATYNITISGTVNGGGLGTTASGASGSTDGNQYGGGGGGASHYVSGGGGGAGGAYGGGSAGSTFDYYDNRTILMKGRKGGTGGNNGAGGNGAGSLRLAAPEIKVNGTIALSGAGGSNAGGSCASGGGGGGSAGKIIIEGREVNLNSSTFNLYGGPGGTGYFDGGCSGSYQYAGGGGGGGAGGILAIFYEDYLTNLSSTVSKNGGGGGACVEYDSTCGNGAGGSVGTYYSEQVEDLGFNIPPVIISNETIPSSPALGDNNIAINVTASDEDSEIIAIYFSVAMPNETFAFEEENGTWIYGQSLLGETEEWNSTTFNIPVNSDLIGTWVWNYTLVTSPIDRENANITSEGTFDVADTIFPLIEREYPENASYNVNVSDFNYTIVESDPNYCWYSKNGGATNSSLQTCMDNWTDVVSVEGSNTWIVFVNDSASNENQTNVTFFKDTTIPLIAFESETEINVSSYNRSFVYANVSVTETNEENITFELYWNNGTLVNSEFSESAIREKNWTGLSYGAYLYNVTVFDSYNQSNYTETRTIYLSDISLFFDGFDERHIELNTTVNISANSTLDFGLICIDIDHPEYGTNYTCSSGSVTTNLSFNYFRKTTFWNDTTTWNFSDFTYNGTNYLTNESLNFTAHQYDEIDNLTINISSTDNVENVIFYGSNTSQIDRYFQGYLVGSNVYLNQSVDSGGTIFNNTNNITFNNPGNATVYFYLDDNATIVNITMNVTCASYGFSYFDEFDDFDDIDTTLSNAQLHYGPGGFIQAPNSSLSLRTFDTFGDASIANHWTYDSTDTDVTCDEGGDPSYSAGVRETGGYLESYAVLENDCVLGAGVTKTYNPNLTNLYYYTSDYISFSIHAYYDGEESTLSEKDCHGINTVKFSDNSIWSFSDGRFYNGHLVYDGSLDFELFKINQTYWRANISGVATETIAIIEDCDDTGGLTITYNYTNGTTFTNWADGDCTDTVVSLSNSSLQEIDISELVIDFSTNARTSEFTAGFTSCDSINTYLRLDNLKNKMWYRDNGTVISNSIFDSANNIASATFNYSSGGSSNANYTATQYLSADNGLHWEAVSNGVEKTFDYPGKHMKWKLVFNTTSPGYQNQSVYITNVTIATPNSNASNIEFDFGNDNTTDYTISGNFTSTNGTITISMASADISSALSSSNRRTNYGHLYKIPLRIYSATTGQINLDTYNITYDPNPVILNYTAIQDFLDDYGSNSTNFTIPIAGANGTVNVSSIQFDYAGGNSTINITVRDVLNTLTLTRYITAYYSRWDYEFVPLYVNWLEFIPKSSKALNVTPYGQTNSTAILNITNYGYGGKNANLSVYLNDTSSCVNLTLSTTWNKENGYQLNSSWRELQSNAIYLNTTNIWMWADYNCSYNNWTLFYPSFYFRQVCDGCTGSEELDY